MSTLPSICRLLTLTRVQDAPDIVSPLPPDNSHILLMPVGGGKIEKFDFVSDKDSEYITMIEQQILDANEGKNAVGVKEEDWIDVNDI